MYTAPSAPWPVGSAAGLTCGPMALQLEWAFVAFTLFAVRIASLRIGFALGASARQPALCRLVRIRLRLVPFLLGMGCCFVCYCQRHGIVFCEGGAAAAPHRPLLHFVFVHVRSFSRAAGGAERLLSTPCSPRPLVFGILRHAVLAPLPMQHPARSALGDHDRGAVLRGSGRG